MEINPSPCADQVQKVCFPLPTATYTSSPRWLLYVDFETSLKRLKCANSGHFTDGRAKGSNRPSAAM